jgi:cell filamentation protein, protein adenylyltransferase
VVNQQLSSGSTEILTENEAGIRSVIHYEIPKRWIQYDPLNILNELTNAKAAVISLTTIPYQREWAKELEQIQLKREVAGTSKIEGADFTDRELDAALRENPEELHTRSQRQAHAAVQTYRWITTLEDDRPINIELMKEIHRRIVIGADDDHCEPGAIRGIDHNVTFGVPRHRGCNGGPDCQCAFEDLMHAVATEFRAHDTLVQALALHYHFAAMHPFQDGNGRTARAVEALMLQRAGLRDSLFIAMSNFYYDEKNEYLAALSAVRAANYDLTPFIKFGLRGIAIQCQRLFREIRAHVSKALFRNVMFDMFGRLESKRKRVIQERQIELLKLFLKNESMELSQVMKEATPHYKDLKDAPKAIIRDLNSLLHFKALELRISGEGERKRYDLTIRLDWATEITETVFYERVRSLPKAKSYRLLQ